MSLDYLRILSLNCWNVSPPYDERLALLRRGIVELRPDLIGLQEIIVRDDGFDMAAALLDGLGYEWAFGSASAWAADGTSIAGAGLPVGFGNVVASRHPIARSGVYALPDCDSGEYRSAILAVVAVPHGPLLFATTHLNWKFQHGFVREQQVLSLAQRIAEWREGIYLPPVLVGDFNADPDAAEVRFLCGLQALEGKSCFFEDAWRVAGDGSPGFTWDNKNPFAAIVSEPDRRLDYVFVGLPHENGRGKIIDCRLAMNQARNRVYPSDHFGVLAEIQV